MRRFFRSISATLFLVSAFHPAHAQAWPPDGKLLEQICQSGNKYDQGVCDGFITGIAASKLVYEETSPKKHCLEGIDISRAQLRAVISSYIIRNRPRIQDIDAGYAVSRALAEAYPCK